MAKKTRKGTSPASGDAAEQEWRRYHCPVCGHWDRVTLSGEEASWIQCSHCDTLLEVLYEQGVAETIPVRVMLEPPPDS